MKIIEIQPYDIRTVIKKIDIIIQKRYSENMYIVQWNNNIFFIYLFLGLIVLIIYINIIFPYKLLLLILF